MEWQRPDVTGPHALTDREKEVLRLLAVGHDVKSAAKALNLTPTAVGERLRTARHKLGVSTSREAARVLAKHEDNDTLNHVDMESGLTPNAERSSLTGHQTVSGTTIMLIAAILAAITTGAYLTNRAGGSTSAVPKVTSVSPAPGGAIKAGTIPIRVTFDQPMRANSYSFVQTDEGQYPSCPGKPVQSKDLRTFTLKCQTLPGRHYVIWFNRGRFANFASTSGLPAVPYRLHFKTLPD